LKKEIRFQKSQQKTNGDEKNVANPLQIFYPKIINSRICYANNVLGEGKKGIA
jgi:hypothetical protein